MISLRSSWARFAGLASLAVAAFATFPTVAPAATFNVSTPSQFTSALTSVQPGDTIVLSGTITSSSTFSTTRAGTASAPITIQGDGTAVLFGSSASGLKIIHDYYRLNNFRIQNVSKGLVIDNANHGSVDNVHIMDVREEAFKVRNQSQYWVFSFCSARRAGTSGQYGEGFYVGQASSNWISGTPDRSGYVTFFNCYTTDTFNDGWDLKEGAHHVKIVNCTADFSGATEPSSHTAFGSAGFFLRCDNVQILKSSVVNLNNGDWGYRMSNQTVNGVDYGSSGNEIKQSSVISGNVPFIYSESGTNGKVYTDCLNGPGGFYAANSAIVAQPSSGFSEMTWSGEGGGIYGALDPDIGTSDPLNTPPPLQVAAPAFNPAGGTYTSAQSVTVSSVTSGASIRYTTNGTTPTSTTGTVYSGPLTISATTALKAIAYKSGMSDSAITSATYTIGVVAQVAAPTFNPAGGTYSSAQSVTISTTTSGASLRYTLDGSTPSESVGTIYSTPIAVSTTTTIKAIGYKTGATTSAVATSTYTITVPGTVIAAAGGAFVNTSMTAQTGTFTATFNATPSASPNNALVGLSNGAQTAFSGLATAVRFNTTGQIDARNGGAYAAANVIPFSANTTYAFRLVVNVPAHTYSIYVTPSGGSELTVGTNYAFRTEQNTVSTLNNWAAVVDTTANGGAGTLTVSSFSLGATPPSAPTFTPAAGSYTSAQSVTIASAGSTSIRYTLDGSTPTTSSTLYSGAISIGATTTLKAIGVNSTGSSSVTTGVYTITIPSSATLSPVADTYAFGGATSTNYGTALILGAKDDGTTATSFDRVAFVKFDLTGLGFTPTTATLVLTTDATTTAGTLTVNQCTTDSWTETGLTWANKPATGAVIGTATVTAGVVADKLINVGSYVNSQYTGDATKIVSFALTGNNAQLYLKSRETGAADSPTLIVGN